MRTNMTITWMNKEPHTKKNKEDVNLSEAAELISKFSIRYSKFSMK